MRWKSWFASSSIPVSPLTEIGDFLVCSWGAISRHAYGVLASLAPSAEKSGRIQRNRTLLTSPEFKDFLHAEAQREGVSVAELIRSRCERRPTEEEAILAALTGELTKAVAESKRALKSGLDEAQAVLTELRAKRGVDAVLPQPRAPLNRKGGRARR